MVDSPDTGPEPEDFAEEEQQLQKWGLHFELTRRRFVQTAGVLSAVAATGLSGFALADDFDPTTKRAVTLKVNGAAQTIPLDPRTSLLDALREHLDLTGTKKGCDHG